MSNSEIPSVTPILTLRPFQPTDEDAVRVRINEQLLRADYSTAIDGAALLANLQHSSPPSVYAVRWQRHQCFCVWRAGMLEGLIDVAVGLDSDSYDLPDYSPLGLLRFFLLPVDEQRIPAVAELLLGAAERFWKQHRVAHIKAFHLSTGYPQFQGGLGALPGDWHAHIHVLTNANYQFTERFYALCRPLDQPLEETMPVAGLSLVLRGKDADRHYQLYRQTERVGEARVIELNLSTTSFAGEKRATRLANVVTFQIDPEWRNRDIGKWLLRRLINDATLQGYHQMLIHIPHRAYIMQNLLIQQGFQEQNYRGYTLETSMTC